MPMHNNAYVNSERSFSGIIKSSLTLIINKFSLNLISEKYVYQTNINTGRIIKSVSGSEDKWHIGHAQRHIGRAHM